MWSWLCRKLGERLARHLQTPSRHYVPFSVSDTETLNRFLSPCDILLVEGNERISTAIKYLTQSSWSHAALYIGDAAGPSPPGEEAKVLLEVDINEGVRAIPLSTYATRHTRICRPVGLSPEDIDKVVGHAVSRLGHRYDLKNIFDLARYLIPNPPIPTPLASSKIRTRASF